MVASARVDSSHRCSSLRASTRRMASRSVSQPKAAPTNIAPSSPRYHGQCSCAMNQAPNTPPSIDRWPVVTDSTLDVEYMTL